MAHRPHAAARPRPKPNHSKLVMTDHRARVQGHWHQCHKALLHGAYPKGEAMSEHAAEPRFGSPLTGPAAQAASEFTGYWWLWLIAGIAWIAISAVLLQFDQASVTTVGVLVGLLFTFAGVQNVAIAS